MWALALLLVAVPVAAGAGYMQPGNGPGRTGAIDFAGPATNDTAFEIELPGTPVTQPAVVDGHAYLFTADGTGYDGNSSHLTEHALWEIDLDTAEVARVLEFPSTHLPLDGGPIGPDRVLLQDFQAGELHLHDVAADQAVWTLRALPEDLRDHRAYFDAVQVDDRLFVTVRSWGSDVPENPLPSMTLAPAPRLAIVSLDAEIGEVDWTWMLEATGSPESVGTSLAADGERVYLYLRRATDTRGFNPTPPAWTYESQFELRALSAHNGESLWVRNDTAQRDVGISTPVAGDSLIGRLGYGCCGYPAITDTAVHIRLDTFEAINPASGQPVWTSEVGRSDHLHSQGSSGMAVRGDVLVATSLQTVYRLDPTDGDVSWQHTEPDVWFADVPAAIDEDTAYLPLGRLQEDCFLENGMEGRDLATGELLWRWWQGTDAGVGSCGSNNRASIPAFGPGLMVWGAKDGTVSVVGRTQASLGVPALDDTMYPPVGEPVTLEVPLPEPGAFGEATRYRIDWGDGTVTGWQEDPVFTHTYEDEGEVTVRVIAANDANQTSSSFITMNVGEPAPTEPNWLSERFEPDNQDMTFGVLGVALAVTGGAIGVTQRYRKRSRLQDELQAIEAAYDETKDRPLECEAQLTERKTHARGLVLDGELDEQQFSVVEQRIEELLRSVRMGAMDDEFDFLPHGLVKRAREMLADGTVSSLEREAFLRAVDEDEVLSSQQKAVVRERIEAWHARDTGAS